MSFNTSYVFKDLNFNKPNALLYTVFIRSPDNMYTTPETINYSITDNSCMFSSKYANSDTCLVPNLTIKSLMNNSIVR